MKVIHIISNKVWGGGERYALDLCKRLRDAGHDVEVICRNRPEIAKRFFDEGFNVFTMRISGIFNALAPLRIAMRLRRQTGVQPIVIHVHNFLNASIACRARKIAKTTNVRIICTRHLVKPAKTTKSYEKLYHRLDAIVFVSQLALNVFLSTHPRIDRSKLLVIHNSVIAPTPTRHTSIQHSPLNLLFIGRIVPEKGLDILLRSLTMLPDVRLTVCGAGNMEYVETLKILSETLGVSKRVAWQGLRDNVYDYIAKADIGVVPSLWAEPFGLTIIEFMSQGIPVVSTDNGAQSEIITNEVDGILVAPNDPSALGSAIGRLAEDPILRARIGDRGRKTFLNRFSYDKFYSRMCKAYGME